MVLNQTPIVAFTHDKQTRKFYYFYVDQLSNTMKYFANLALNVDDSDNKDNDNKAETIQLLRKVYSKNVKINNLSDNDLTKLNQFSKDIDLYREKHSQIPKLEGIKIRNLIQYYCLKEHFIKIDIRTGWMAVIIGNDGQTLELLIDQITQDIEKLNIFRDRLWDGKKEQYRRKKMITAIRDSNRKDFPHRLWLFSDNLDVLRKFRDYLVNITNHGKGVNYTKLFKNLLKKYQIKYKNKIMFDDKVIESMVKEFEQSFNDKNKEKERQKFVQRLRKRGCIALAYKNTLYIAAKEKIMIRDAMDDVYQIMEQMVIDTLDVKAREQKDMRSMDENLIRWF